MADIAKYQRDLQRFNSSYAKEAVKEPFNFWGLAGFAVAAVTSSAASAGTIHAMPRTITQSRGNW